jgi:uncharacterized protein YciI
MYIVELTYLKPLAELDAQLTAHRAFLDTQYGEGLFLASGPKNPRDGGIIIASGRIERSALDALLATDPFQIHGLASYRIIDFEPVKFAPALATLL